MKIKESLILEISDQNGETESIIIPDNSETTVKAAICAIGNNPSYIESYCKGWRYDGHMGSYHDGVKYQTIQIEVVS